MNGERTCPSTDQPVLIYTVDSFSNGIAFGQHRLERGHDPRDFNVLRLTEREQVNRLRSHYSLHKDRPLWELERALQRLSEQGRLTTATIYFGTSSDPFHPFEGKFDASMRFLSLFERYTPGMLLVQTRSPLIVIAMPVLRRLGERAEVTIGLETNKDEVVKRFTPGLPRVEERLRAVQALRRCGVKVALQVSPLLPYGEWRADADAFAALLDQHSDRLYVRGLIDGTPQSERTARRSEVAKLLVRERCFHWLRPDAANPLINALEKRCVQKLQTPKWRHFESRQLGIFAA